MTRTTRATQNIFAGSASNNGQFGSLQAGTKVDTNNLATIQALPAYASGWNSATVGSQQVPALEEMQGLDFMITTQLVYLFQEGIPEYDAGTTYYGNSIVKNPGTYQIYGSLGTSTTANTGNALSNATYWKLLCDLSNPATNVAWAGTAAGTANALTLTATGVPAAPSAGQTIIFIGSTANTSGTVTVAINGGAAKNITKLGSLALSVNDITTNVMIMGYDGTQWQLIILPVFAQGADVVAAATLSLAGINGNVVNVTGNTGISAVSLSAGRTVIVRFTGTPLLTHGGNCYLNAGGANYQVVAGDMAIITALAGGAYVNIIPTSGKSVIPPVPNAAAITVLTSSGTWTSPADTTSATVFKITQVASGGGGAGIASTAGGGAGGGAGGTCVLYKSGLPASTGYTYTQGAAGAAGGAGNNAGGAAGNSTFVVGGTTITSNGGAGGASFVSSTTPIPGGTGGTASGGSINIQGGGGGGGNDINGTNGGLGGASSLGGGGYGNYDAVGGAGSAYGSGGGSVGSNNGNFAGGAGAAGILIIERVSG
jgi:hypothetical protein